MLMRKISKKRYLRSYKRKNKSFLKKIRLKNYYLLTFRYVNNNLLYRDNTYIAYRYTLILLFYRLFLLFILSSLDALLSSLTLLLSLLSSLIFSLLIVLVDTSYISFLNSSRLVIY